MVQCGPPVRQVSVLRGVRSVAVLKALEKRLF